MVLLPISNKSKHNYFTLGHSHIVAVLEALKGAEKYVTIKVWDGWYSDEMKVIQLVISLSCIKNH